MSDLEHHSSIPDPVRGLSLNDVSYEAITKGDRIDRGGEADVYHGTVRQGEETHPVAIKEPRFEGTIQREVVERFQDEAKIWAQLAENKNIVSVYGYGSNSLPWIALEYMDGGTLDAHIGDLPIEESLWVTRCVCEGVRHGHRHGVAHLDIKPSNILLRETPMGKWNYPKVSDWGLSKKLVASQSPLEFASGVLR